MLKRVVYPKGDSRRIKAKIRHGSYVNTTDYKSSPFSEVVYCIQEGHLEPFPVSPKYLKDVK